MSKVQSRFRLEPQIIEAMDLARGKVPRMAFVRDAVLLKLRLLGFTVEVPTRACAQCGEPFVPVRKQTRFCSQVCRTYASRARIEAGGRLRPFRLRGPRHAEDGP